MPSNHFSNYVPGLSLALAAGGLGYSTRIYLDAPPYNGDLVGAVTDVAIPSPCELVFTSLYEQTDDIAIELPTTMHAVFEGNGGIKPFPGGGLLGPGDVIIRSMDDRPNYQLFYTAEGGRVLVGNKAVPALKQVWWTGHDSNGVDDTPQIQQIVDSFNMEYDARGPIFGAAGGEVILAAGNDWRVFGIRSTSNTIWSGRGNNNYAGQGVGGTTWILPETYTPGGSMIDIFQNTENVTIRDLSLDIDTADDAQCLVQHGIPGAGSQYNTSLERVTFRAVGADHMPLHEVKSDSGSDWECVDNYYHKPVYVIGENGIGWKSGGMNSHFLFTQPLAICVGALATPFWSDGHQWLEIIERDFRGPAGADYNAVSEILDRTITSVSADLPSHTFATTDVDATNDTLHFASGFTPHVGDRVRFTTTGSLPGGLSTSTDYWVKTWNKKTLKLTLATTSVLSVTKDITSTGSGTHTITTFGTHFVSIVSGGTFSADDRGQQIKFDGGTITSYVINTYSATTVKVNDEQTGSTFEVDAKLYRQTKSQELGYAGIVINKDHGTTIIRNGAEEGFIYGLFVSSTASNQYGAITLDYPGIEGSVRTECHVDIDVQGGTFWGLSFEQIGGTGTVIRHPSTTVQNITLLRGGDSWIGTRRIEVPHLYLNYTNEWEKPNESLSRYLWPDFTSTRSNRMQGPVTIFDLKADVPADNTQAVLNLTAILSQGGAEMKDFLWMGIVDAVNPEQRLEGYSFRRSGDTGYLEIEGDQSSTAFKGVKFYDQIFSPSLNGVIVTQPANFATLTIADTKTLSVTDNATISNTNTGDQLVFKTISVSGQSDVVADTTTDTLTFVAGSGMTITTNATTDTITFASSGGGSFSNTNGILYWNGTATTNDADFTFDGTVATISGSATASTFRLGSLEVQSTGVNNNLLLNNGSYNGSQFLYRANGFFNAIQFINGGWAFWSATSGTAGTNAGTFQPFTLSQAGAGVFASTLAASNLSGTNTGDVTLAGENYLSRSSQVITANAVNLSGTNVTGTLASARFPALTGDVTTSSGSLATTIASNAVSDSKLRQSAGLSIIGRSANSTGNVADITASTDGDILRRSGTSIGFGAIREASVDRPVVATASSTASPALSDSGTYYRMSHATPTLNLPSGGTIGKTVFYVTFTSAVGTIDPVGGSDVIEGWWIDGLDFTSSEFTVTGGGGSITINQYCYAEIRYVDTNRWALIGTWINI